MPIPDGSFCYLPPSHGFSPTTSYSAAWLSSTASHLAAPVWAPHTISRPTKCLAESWKTPVLVRAIVSSPICTWKINELHPHLICCICSSKYPTPCLSFSDCIWEPGNVCKPPHVHTTFFQKSKHFLNTFLSSKTWTQIFRYSHDTKFMVFSLILYFPYSHLACTAFHLSILN